jgi:hypothetical protein
VFLPRYLGYSQTINRAELLALASGIQTWQRRQNSLKSFGISFDTQGTQPSQDEGL